METGERLKYIRGKTGFSQQKFAEFIDEKFSRINSIESGKHVKFPYDLAEKIMKKFPDEHYNFKWITTGEGDISLKKTISPEEREHLEKAERIVDRLIHNITDAEIDLVTDCLVEKKELTIMLLKKLKSDEKAVKRFLLD